MIDILSLLYHLKSEKIYIWLNSNKDIAFSHETSSSLPKHIKADLRQCKSQLLEILSLNEISSEEIAKNTAIFKVPDTLKLPFISPVQKGIYLQGKLDAQHYTYNIPLFIRFDSADISHLKTALKLFIKKHSIFKLVIEEDFRYNLLEEDSFPIFETEIHRDELESLCAARYREPFILDGGRLFQAEILKINNSNEVVLNLTHHHILADAYSIELIISEVLKFYSQLCMKNLDVNVNCSEYLSYFDFCAYQSYMLSTSSYKYAVDDLANKLNQAEKLSLNKKSNLHFDNEGDSFNFILSTSIYHRLNQISLEYKVSLYSILLTSLYYVLSTYGRGQVNFPVGITLSNRPFEFKEVIGPFISSLPLIPNRFDSKESFLSNSQHINQEIIYLNEHQHINLNILGQNLTRSTRDLLDLMQIMFTFHNPINSNKEINYDIIDVEEEAEQFGISITAKDLNGMLSFNINYARNLYEGNYIRSIFDSFQTLLSKIDKENIVKPLSQFSLLGSEQFHEVVYTWNQGEASYPEDETLHGLFEAQAKLTPDRIAAIYQDHQITYDALNKRANQLAYYLRKKGVATESLVGIGIDRSIDMLVGILAVLKAGGAYIPLDPSSPEERLEYMLEDSQAKLLLIHSRSGKQFKNFKGEIIDTEDWGPISHERIEDPGYSVTSDNIALIIFTSGSTGRPKGIMIEHKKKIHHIYLLINHLSLNKNDKIAQTASQGFDISVWQMLAPILIGGCTHIFDTSLVKDPHSFLQALTVNSITIVQLVSTYLEALVGIAANGDFFPPQFRWVIATAESVPATVYQRCLDIFGAPMVNVYGPAECSDDVTLYYVRQTQDIKEPIPIGKVLPNMQIYILDGNLEPVPIGAIGEIYIGGEGVARGYLNRPSLTADRFIPNLFATDVDTNLGKNLRLYRTGDLGRYLPDGNLEFWGRADAQVKIRGHRIELGEIESAIQGAGFFSGCLVLSRENEEGDKVLIAWIFLGEGIPREVETTLVDSSGKDFSILKGEKLTNLTEELRTYLSKKIPDYMIPSFFVYIDRIPVTVNGKTDYKSLQSMPARSLHMLGKEYEGPGNEIERQVCQIWSKVLGIPEDRIGIYDDFFKLGGNSILAIKLIREINRELNLNATCSALFRHNSVNKLVDVLQRGKDDLVSINKISNSKQCKYLPLSFAQERLWFIEKYEEGTNAYNLPMIFQLSTDIQIDILEKSIAGILERHEILRTLIKEDSEGSGYQLVCYLQEHPFRIIKIPVQSLQHLNEELDKQVNYIFDLETEYPIRVCVYELADSNSFRR